MGERIAQGTNPEELKEHLLSWAYDVVKRMPKDVSNKKRNRFNTACVVFDEASGKLYFGRNGGIDKFRDKRHPKLDRILPPKSLTRYTTTWNCAESDAINRALWAGVRLRDMRIYVVEVRINKMGVEKISCKNCTYAYKRRIKKNFTGWSK